jgi:high-affinity nickel-transport protein
MADPMGRIHKIRHGLTRREWSKVGAMAGTVVVLNVAGWAMLVAACSPHHVSKAGAFGFGTGVLAYTLGIRHAFDADHIAAIDNTTRKLVQDGKRPLSTGFWFSLGHSSVVFVLAILLNFGIRALNAAVQNGSSGLHTWTGIIGTTVSGTFLWAIGLLNLVVLMSIIRVTQELRAGRYDDEELERQLDSRGLMNRLFGGYARHMDQPWKLYPVGVLFGLGFDTATEIALLVLAGTAVVGGLPFYAILSLPILFAAGMCLFDTVDGCFMNFAYDWAFAKPVRKVWYNLTVTGLSVFVALFIGTIEIVGLVARQAGWTGGVLGIIGRTDINTAGLIIVAVFVATWMVSLAVWHIGDIESRWQVLPAEVLAPTDEPLTANSAA